MHEQAWQLGLRSRRSGLSPGLYHGILKCLPHLWRQFSECDTVQGLFPQMPCAKRFWRQARSIQVKVSKLSQLTPNRRKADWERVVDWARMAVAVCTFRLCMA